MTPPTGERTSAASKGALRFLEFFAALREIRLGGGQALIGGLDAVARGARGLVHDLEFFDRGLVLGDRRFVLQFRSGACAVQRCLPLEGLLRAIHLEARALEIGVGARRLHFRAADRRFGRAHLLLREVDRGGRLFARRFQAARADARQHLAFENFLAHVHHERLDVAFDVEPTPTTWTARMVPLIVISFGFCSTAGAPACTGGAVFLRRCDRTPAPIAAIARMPAIRSHIPRI